MTLRRDLADRHLHAGKVRDLYAVGDAHVLVVASDRISAYDVVLPTLVPDKGAVLTALSVWWFGRLADLVDHHLVTARVGDYPAELAPYAAELRGRSMLCHRLAMVPVECVARGYLTGSGLADYQAGGAAGGAGGGAGGGAVGGHRLPAGLRDGDRLNQPLFTPARKAAAGEHDENVTPAQVAETLGVELAGELERLTLAVYRRAAGLAESRGILLADTKLEFGHDAGGRLRLGDEVLTPDSSRWWPADGWAPGRASPSYDKQPVRDWLRASWDGSGPPPALPDDVVAATRERYVTAYERLTGLAFADWLRAG